MGSSNSIVLDRSEIDDIAKETNFTSGQIKRLHTRFTSLDKDNLGYLRKEDLSTIPELNINPVRERIIEVLINDYGIDGRLNFKQFARVLSTFRRKTGVTGSNSVDSKLRFIFDVYDRDKDNRISRNELMSILGMIVGDNLPDEQMNAIAERTILELGLPLETGITYEKFCDCLKKIDIDEKMSMKFLA
ncbi:unnamed protein product [Brachionus calyciflorus]|uniref:EF-hand domain-containing protein n=1 Tax=Brachionus calyciflorus TaxID=104777 RepID=A0A813QNL3_9BILA|nr:unnamed protein product [Brachionus calyciflorus]